MSLRYMKMVAAVALASAHNPFAPEECFHCHAVAAQAELKALEKAAKDLTRLHLADGVDRIAHSERVIAEMTDSRSQWFHPDVTAWGEAAAILEKIVKEAE